MKHSICVLFTFFIVALLFFTCKKTEDLIDFTEEDERLLGEKLAQKINQAPNYLIISPTNNTALYTYANTLLMEITSTSPLAKSDKFIWTIFLIDDESRGAFALPGGYIYITTGMLFFLENEDQFSGLLTHFISHINQSHITKALFNTYGIADLKAIASGSNEIKLEEIIKTLDPSDNTFQMARSHETETDTLGISFLKETEQACEAVAYLFSRLLTIQPDQQTSFITTHQLTTSRIQDIEQAVSKIGCNTMIDNEAGERFRAFRNLIP